MISQGPSICLFNKEDPQEVLASWLFMQYMLTNAVQIPYAQTEGYVPVTTKAQNAPEYLDYLSRSGEDNELYYSIKQFKGLANLSTYLYRIAYNVLQDHLRRNRFTHTTDIIPECVISTHNDTHIDITRALQQLTPTERAAITLYYIDDRKVEDVASILQLPAGTVKSHLSRARNKIADFLKNNGYE